MATSNGDEMELEKKPEEIPELLREEVESEVAKPGLEPFHDELESALDLADALGTESPAEVIVKGQVVPTTALLDWIDDLRELKEEDEDEKVDPSDEQSGMVPDFLPDSAIAIGLEVREPPNDDDFFAVAQRRRAEDVEEEPEDGGGGGGGGGGDGDADDKPKPPPDDKNKPAAGKTPASKPDPKTPPGKPAPGPKPGGPGGNAPK